MFLGALCLVLWVNLPLSVPMPYCFSSCGFIMINSRANHPYLVFRIVLVLHLSYKFQHQLLSIPVESPVVIFIGNMCLYINFEVIACFTIWVLSSDDMVYLSLYSESFLCSKYKFIISFINFLPFSFLLLHLFFNIL